MYKINVSDVQVTTQPAITCSNSTIDTLEQGVEYVESKERRHQNDVNGLNPEHISHFVLVFLLLTVSS